LNPFYVATMLDSIAWNASYRYGWELSMRYIHVGWGLTQSVIYLSWAAVLAGLAYRGVKINWRK
ncbi:MAG: hypothetical protein P3X24_002885, partial [bacterium]|nr:hypothetical protein [bacterium]